MPFVIHLQWQTMAFNRECGVVKEGRADLGFIAPKNIADIQRRIQSEDP